MVFCSHKMLAYFPRFLHSIVIKYSSRKSRVSLGFIFCKIHHIQATKYSYFLHPPKYWISYHTNTEFSLTLNHREFYRKYSRCLGSIFALKTHFQEGSGILSPNTCYRVIGVSDPPQKRTVYIYIFALFGCVQVPWIAPCPIVNINWDMYTLGIFATGKYSEWQVLKKHQISIRPHSNTHDGFVFTSC